jgi:hypothetical protein
VAIVWRLPFPVAFDWCGLLLSIALLVFIIWEARGMWRLMSEWSGRLQTLSGQAVSSYEA